MNDLIRTIKKMRKHSDHCHEENCNADRWKYANFISQLEAFVSGPDEWLEKNVNTNDPYVNNCVLIPRMGEKGMFQIHKGNFISPYLEGYLIMPIEDYDGSLKFKGLKTAQKRIGKK